MNGAYILNSALEVIPDAGSDRFLVRVPLLGQSLDASRYQIGVLQQFREWSELDAVLSSYPFEKAETRRFLTRCVAKGVLLARTDRGLPILPDRVVPSPSLFRTPELDPEAPSAFAFLGVPLDTNTSGWPGARFGPTSIRMVADASHYTLDETTLQPVGFIDFASGRRVLRDITLADAGDVRIAAGESPTVVYDRITSEVQRVLDLGSIPLILGGDHSITYPVLRAFPHERLAVVQLDAHTDLGDSEPSGLHHGCVFSVVLEKLEFVEHVYQMGLRGFVEAAQDQTHKRATWIGMDRLRADGIATVVRGLPADIPYYLSIDIDVLDPCFAPSTGTPVAGGLFPHELKSLVREIASTRNVVGVDVVEVCQSQGPADATAAMAVECLLTAADAIVAYQTASVVRESQGGAT